MIYVTRLNDSELVINCQLIESLEASPDTIITMTTGRKYFVSNTIEEIIQKTIEYNRQTAIAYREGEN